METRAKDLKDPTMWQLSNSCVKFLDLCDAIFSKFRLFGRNLSIAATQIYGKGFSKFNNELTVSFLYDQIGQYLATDVQKPMPSHSPLITISFKEMVSCFFLGRGTGSLKSILQPMKEPDIGVGNLQNGSIMAVLIPIVRFVFELTSMKTPLSIDNSSKIRQMKWIMGFGFVKNSMFVVRVGELHSNLLVTGSPNSVHVKCV